MAIAINALTAEQRRVVHSTAKMIITYYGDGKGKTTAALGLALRSSGYRKKILFAQFVKSPKSLTGEGKALKKIKGLVHKKFGLGFIGLYDDSKPLEEHRKAARKGLEFVLDMRNKFELIVLDEVLGAIKGNLLKMDEVADLIKDFPKDKDLVLTGRPRFKKIIELSDLVSEMREIKHPFRRGKMAKKGVDY